MERQAIVNLLLAIPVPLRTAAVFVLGVLLGGQLNRAIYRLGWRPRRIGPWSPPEEGAPPRRWWDRTPILGWILLTRESPLHGAGYWIRPLCIELLAGAGLAALYWWEVHGGLVPAGVRLDRHVMLALHAQFAGHVILISLMTVASFIDLDEKTIPDAVTTPGTLTGLVWMTLLPTAQLPILAFTPAGAVMRSLSLTSSATSPFWLEGMSGRHTWPVRLNDWDGLLIGAALFLAWCFAIHPKTWTTRRGWRRAFQYLAVSSVRHRGWWRTPCIALAGTAAIAAVWGGGGLHWQSLLTSLVGMAFGGGLVWAVRIVASSSLGKEAMGFGDVTLMAMIGAFLGWQPALIVFFLAPLAAVAVSVAQWLITRRREIAFGPYLCLAALALLRWWRAIWEGWAREVFSIGWLVPSMTAACLVLMAGMLCLWRAAGGGGRELGPDSPEEKTEGADQADAGAPLAETPADPPASDAENGDAPS